MIKDIIIHKKRPRGAVADRLETGAAYIGTRPSRGSVQSICRRVSELTVPRHVLLPPGVVVGRLNRLAAAFKIAKAPGLVSTFG